MTTKQYEYLRDLINRHPNFKKEVGHDGIHQDAEGQRHFFLNNGLEKEIIGTEDEVQTAWVNSKYGQYLDHLINSVHDLDNETASALITHLQLRNEKN